MRQTGHFQFAPHMLPGGVMWLLCLILLLPFHLPACAMSAIIATGDHQLSDFDTEGMPSAYPNYNDPWDYLAFVMANSLPYTNSDGYGVVGYRTVSPALQGQDMWHKRVLSIQDLNRIYYTGNYLRDTWIGMPAQMDTLDCAMQSLQNSRRNYVIALAHARNATGITLGNHPFWFHQGARSFSFMHNGNANGARRYMIEYINSSNTGEDWFHRFPSNYFNDPDPNRWVDSEVLFHYIIKHINASNEDTKLGIIRAMLDIRHYLNAASYNFIMSDGEKLYAFRSSSSSSYQLSYQCGEGWYGIRTQQPTNSEIPLRPWELVVLSQTDDPEHVMIRDFQDDSLVVAASISRIRLLPNPARRGGMITIIPEYPLGTGKQQTWVEIFNTKGQLLLRKEASELARGASLILQTSSLSSGVHFCRIRGGGYSELIRFSIVN